MEHRQRIKKLKNIFRTNVLDKFRHSREQPFFPSTKQTDEIKNIVVVNM